MTTPPARILVTDDDPLMLSAATRLLTSAGYEVIPAINGEQTLQLAQAHHPDLMLLDVILPDIEGTEVCRRIKTDTRIADIFIILLSGVRTGSDEQSDAMEGGADGYIARPIANRELLARVQAFMRIKTAEQKLKEYARQYENLYNFAPVGYFTLGRDGVIQKANFAGAKLLGIPSEELIQRSFGLFVSATFRAAFADFLEKVFTSRNKETCEVALQGDGTASVWVNIEAILNSDETCQAAVSDITERSQNETQREISVNALRESEERLALVLEGSQLGYWDWNIATDEVQRNERWAKMLGYTLDEIKLNVNQWADLQHPDDRAVAWKSIQDHLDGHTPIYKAEYRMLTKSGEYKWILDCARIVKRDANGRPLRMSGTHTDINERKQVEQALHESELHFRKTLENISLIALELDNTGRITFCNDFFLQLTNWQRDEVMGQDWFSLFVPDNEREQIRSIFFEGINSGSVPLHYINELQTRHGAERLVSWSNIVLRDPSGNPVGIVSIGEDITERKQAEDALRASEAQYRLLAEHMDDVVWLMDIKANKFVYVSPSVYKLRGYTPQEVMSQPVSASITPESGELIQQTLVKAFQFIQDGKEIPSIPVSKT